VADKKPLSQQELHDLLDDLQGKISAESSAGPRGFMDKLPNQIRDVMALGGWIRNQGYQPRWGAEEQMPGRASTNIEDKRKERPPPPMTDAAAILGRVEELRRSKRLEDRELANTLMTMIQNPVAHQAGLGDVGKVPSSPLAKVAGISDLEDLMARLEGRVPVSYGD
jgi:hypothetical protein